jgi:hypothetical protein
MAGLDGGTIGKMAEKRGKRAIPADGAQLSLFSMAAKKLSL